MQLLHRLTCVLALTACATAGGDDATDSSELSSAWLTQHIPPDSALERSILAIANDPNISASKYRYEIGLSALATYTLINYRDGIDPDDPNEEVNSVTIDSIAELDSVSHTSRSFFEKLIAFATRDAQGAGPWSSGCKPHYPAQPPDAWWGIAAPPNDDALQWRFWIPHTGARVGKVGVTVKAPVAGTLFAAIVEAPADEAPADQCVWCAIEDGVAVANALLHASSTASTATASFDVDLAPGRYALVFGAGYFGATLPSASIATVALGTCKDVHSYSAEFPEDIGDQPLEDVPEFFLETSP